MKKFLSAMAAAASVSLAIPVMAQVYDSSASVGADTTASAGATMSADATFDDTSATDMSVSSFSSVGTTTDQGATTTDDGTTTTDDGMTTDTTGGVGTTTDTSGSIPSALPDTGGGGMAHAS